ncbi:MAG: DNA topoisomerase IV subunit A [Deltaproteobacteria bacterium]|nr:DNA topoisomerase IV subunit A [Deltaproteobacteria bacterium]
MPPPPPSVPPPPPGASLADEAQRRYLAYALSVITARALPDVRDGLKPVQRRILYTMHNNLRLLPDGRHKKSAAIVGEVLGKYHPHSDVAVYDAMVRLAQPWTMRVPLVDGQGNFGSADGDAPAAMRYTEAKLRAAAVELLSELGQKTVAWRPNYDGTLFEPVVLPARFPHLLVNGSQGIAVGMATSIPPHNLGEVVDACRAMIENPALSLKQALKHVKGPDFPTGGQLLSTRDELEAIYETGSGSLKLRAEWKTEEHKGRTDIVLTSIPYGNERSAVVEKIAEVIINKKLPALLDVRDESTDEVRVVLELKKDADPQIVMAYLFKHTPLAVNVQVNLTCLVPGVPTTADERVVEREDGEVPARPERLGLLAMLRHFLDFRFLTVTRRTAFELAEVRRRIHILVAFETIFDALDETIRIIRKSDNRKDAAEKLAKRFSLDDEQVAAILELRLYKLAKLEIEEIRKELAALRKDEKRLAALLASDKKRWDLVNEELASIRATYADKRRTKVVGAVDEPEIRPEDFIVVEDTKVVVTAQGWVKRVRELKDIAQTRVREGDQVMCVVPGSTREVVAFWSNRGNSYVCRIADVPATTGYGDPVQKLFKLDDGERLVGATSFDPRPWTYDAKHPATVDVPPPSEGAEEPEQPFALAVTKRGLAFRFSLRPHREPTTRAGRRFARLNDDDEVLAVLPCDTYESVVAATTDGHALAVALDEITVLGGPGKGVMLMKVDEGERLVGVALARGPRDSLVVETAGGKETPLTDDKYRGTRAGRGAQVVKRGGFTRAVAAPPVIPVLEEPS